MHCFKLFFINSQLDLDLIFPIITQIMTKTTNQMLLEILELVEKPRIKTKADTAANRPQNRFFPFLDAMFY